MQNEPGAEGASQCQHDEGWFNGYCLYCGIGFEEHIAALQQQLDDVRAERDTERERAAVYGQTISLMVNGHCEDKRLHWLLPYEGLIYCECGFKLELTDEQTIALHAAFTPDQQPN